MAGTVGSEGSPDAVSDCVKASREDCASSFSLRLLRLIRPQGSRDFFNTPVHPAYEPMFRDLHPFASDGLLSMSDAMPKVQEVSVWRG